MAGVDPDFSRDIVDGLYRHRPCSLAVCALLAIPVGVLGAHRFYCGRFWTGIAMLMTLGGGLIWWIWDLFRLRRMVEQTNARERRRELEGRPPRGMGFLPARHELRLDQPPVWAAQHSGKARVVTSALMLGAIGLCLGAATGATQSWEAVIVLTLFIAISTVAARRPGLAQLPLFGALLRWVHRLRLFYHTVDPGSVTSLALRPVFGIVLAPWRPRVRAEVRLHLQMGGAVALLLGMLDAFELIVGSSLAAGLAALMVQLLQTVLFTYLFVAPASALLTTQLLLSRHDQVVWALSALTLASMFGGVTLTAN